MKLLYNYERGHIHCEACQPNASNTKLGLTQGNIENIRYCLRTKVRADFKIWGTLFSAPLFSGLNQWFRPKTIWGTHQTGSQRSKRPFFDFFKIFFEKSWFFRQKTKKKIFINTLWSEMSQNLFQT